jgi:excisionase family DNA binding protein
MNAADPIAKTIADSVWEHVEERLDAWLAAQRHVQPQPANAGDDPWMTSGEAAAYLRLSRDRLEALRAAAKGPRHVDKGRRIRYRKSDCDAWLAGAEGQS